MEKPASTAYPIHELLAQRWSPRAFSGEPVTQEHIRQLFEAARWAPSCFNEQPWRYLVATRDDAEAFETLCGCLVEANQAWAKDAGALAIGVTSDTFARNGKPNRHASHDLGLANALLTVQAESMGLRVHMMAGIQYDKIRESFGIPEGYSPLVGIAIGQGARPETLPEELAEKEKSPRERKPQSNFLFTKGWDQVY